MHRILILAVIVAFSLEGVNYQILSAKLKKKAPEWMLEQVQQDLEPFQEKGVTKEALLATPQRLAHSPRTFLCKVFEGQVEFFLCRDLQPVVSDAMFSQSDRFRFKAINYAITHLSKYYGLSDMEFIISLEDSVDEEYPAPVMTFAKNKNVKSSVLFPDYEAIWGYKSFIKEVARGNALYPSHKKVDKAFWRGSTTGGAFTVSNWREYPRSQLVLFSKKHPELVDAKYTNIVPGAESRTLQKIFQDLRILSQPVIIPDHIQYRYLIDIDGNSCSYARLVWILMTSSLCLKQESDNIQWYYKQLKPYVHYLPFKPDMSDFKQQILWARSHPEEVYNIIDAANTFVKEHLTQELVFQYIHVLLQTYAKLMPY